VIGRLRKASVSGWYVRSLYLGFLAMVAFGYFMFFFPVSSVDRFVWYIVGVRLVQADGSPMPGVAVIALRPGKKPGILPQPVSHTDGEGYAFDRCRELVRVPICVLRNPWTRDTPARSFDFYAAIDGNWVKIGRARGCPAPENVSNSGLQLDPLPSWASDLEVLEATLDRLDAQSDSGSIPYPAPI